MARRLMSRLPTLGGARCSCPARSRSPRGRGASRVCAWTLVATWAALRPSPAGAEPPRQAATAAVHPAAAGAAAPVHTGAARVRGRRRGPTTTRSSAAARREAAPTLRLPGAQLRQARDLSDALDTVPGVRVVRVGGHGAATSVQLRGASPQQTRVALGATPLASPTGRPVDLESLPTLALGSAEIWRGRAPAGSGIAPIGGTLQLHPARGGSAVRAQLGSYGATVLEGRASWGRRRAGSLSLRWLTSDGDFPYLWDSGTPLVSGDDVSRRRGNNHVRRLSGLLRQRWRGAGRWQARLTWLGGWRRQGLPGLAVAESGHAALDAHRHDLNLRLTHRGPSDTTQLWLTGGGEALAVDDRLGELGPVQHRRQLLGALELGARWRRRVGRWRPRAALVARTGAARSTERLTARTSPVATQGQASASAGFDARLGSLLLSPTLRAVAAWSRRVEDRSWTAQWESVATPTRALATAALAARWRLGPSWSLFGSAVWANRTPTLVELFGNDGTVRPSPRLDDERALTATAGVVGRGRLGPWRLHLNAQGFVGRRWQLIQLVRAAPGQAIHTNVGAADVAGADVSAHAELRRRLSVAAAWSRLHARDDTLGYGGNALPLRPASRWSGSVALRTRAGAPGLWARWRAALRWQAGTFTDRANLVVVPGRTELDASVTLLSDADTASLGRWQVALAVDNITDTRRFDLVGLPLPGRTWRLTWQWAPAPPGSTTEQEPR